MPIYDVERFRRELVLRFDAGESARHLLLLSSELASGQGVLLLDAATTQRLSEVTGVSDLRAAYDAAAAQDWCLVWPYPRDRSRNGTQFIVQLLA